MGRITKEAVFHAAEAVAASGERPSQTKIRQFLGGGSFTDIGPLLKDWHEARKVVGSIAAMEMPESARDAMAEIGARLWKIASDEAAQAIEAARRDFVMSKQSLAQEAEDAQDAICTLESERDDLAAEMESLRARDADHEATVLALSEAKTRASVGLEVSKQTITRLEGDLARVQSQIEHLSDQARKSTEMIHGLKADLAQKEALIAANDRRMAELERDRDSLASRSADAETRADRLRVEIADRQADISALRDQYAAMSSRHEADIARSQAETTKARQEATALKRQLEALRPPAKPLPPQPPQTIQQSQPTSPQSTPLPQKANPAPPAQGSR